MDTNVNLLHETRDWLASQGHSATAEYQIVIRRRGERQPIALLTLLPDMAPMMPTRPPSRSALADEFLPTSVQKKILDALRGGKRLTKKQIAAIVGTDRIYLLKRGGVDELARVGFVRIVDGDGGSGSGNNARFELTDAGSGLAADLFEDVEESEV